MGIMSFFCTDKKKPTRDQINTLCTEYTEIFALFKTIHLGESGISETNPDMASLKLTPEASRTNWNFLVDALIDQNVWFRFLASYTATENEQTQIQISLEEYHELTERIDLLKDAVKLIEGNMEIADFEDKYLKPDRWVRNCSAFQAITCFLGAVAMIVLICAGVFTFGIGTCVAIGVILVLSAFSGCRAYYGYNEYKAVKEFTKKEKLKPE